MTESSASFSETLTSLLITSLGTTVIEGEESRNLSVTTWPPWGCERARKRKYLAYV